MMWKRRISELKIICDFSVFYLDETLPNGLVKCEEVMEIKVEKGRLSRLVLGKRKLSRVERLPVLAAAVIAPPVVPVMNMQIFFDLQPIDVLHSNNVGTRENHRKLSTRYQQKSFLRNLWINSLHSAPSEKTDDYRLVQAILSENSQYSFAFPLHFLKKLCRLHCGNQSK